jgi:4-diphosphocytidyl-2-C-methyl-D-erythritol kinase
MNETAYAKLNLALHVRGREPDGYHRIETLFAFAEDGDRLSVSPGDGLSLALTGPFAAELGDPQDNLVLRAARLLGGGKGAALTLDKRLPVAAGIGGGSADAATIAPAVAGRRLDLGEKELLALAGQLGADVPACLLSRTLRGTGRGDRLEPAEADVAGTPVLLVNPGVPVATAEVFRRWRGITTGGNDLEPPARELAPVIGDVLETLRTQPGLTLTRMSGSGATCFGLFESEAARDSAAASIGASRPLWWRLASRLR